MEDTFLDRVVAHVEQTIKEGRQVIWMFHGRSSTRKEEHVLFAPFHDDEEKRRLLFSIRIYTVMHEIDEYVIVSEAWMRTAASRDEVVGRIADHPDRVECLIVVNVKRENDKRLGRMRMYQMHRDGGGALTSLERLPDYKELGGDMIDLISPKTAGEDARKQAELAWEIGKKIGYIPNYEPVLSPTVH